MGTPNEAAPHTYAAKGNGMPPFGIQPKQEKPDPFIGKTIGNCIIQKKINEGGTAHIYKARNVRFDLDRVVKLLKPSLAEEEDFFIRFTQEAQLTARLDHPNILRVFDTGEVDGYFYIEMEHIEGETLRAYLQHTPRINEREILHIGLQVAQALNYAHNIEIKAPNDEVIHGILHRDIKPENIMIMPNHAIKLMDFGAAKPLNITSNTMQGMIVGTFHYMSPEQIDGKGLDVRSDFFSLGIVLYELCSGQRPFTAPNLTRLIERIKECKYPPLRKLRPSISFLTEELIEKLLSKNKAHRPPAAKEIVESLNICIQSYNTWGTGKRIKVPFSFRRAVPSLSLMVSLVALGLSAYAVIRTPRPPHESAALKGVSSISLLEKGREIERKEQWSEAVSVYELVPSVKDGGIANEYLEAQIRCAYLSFQHLNQLTKASNILERLRLEYSDPAIDAYLGMIYFKRSLYHEARERIEVALGSKKGSVIAHTPEFKRELLYYHASSLDRQYIYVNRDENLLREAIKSWDYYIEFSNCTKVSKDKECSFAFERKADLEKIDKKMQ